MHHVIMFISWTANKSYACWCYCSCTKSGTKSGNSWFDYRFLIIILNMSSIMLNHSFVASFEALTLIVNWDHNGWWIWNTVYSLKMVPVNEGTQSWIKSILTVAAFFLINGVIINLLLEIETLEMSKMVKSGEMLARNQVHKRT